VNSGDTFHNRGLEVTVGYVNQALSGWGNTRKYIISPPDYTVLIAITSLHKFNLAANPGTLGAIPVDLK